VTLLIPGPLTRRRAHEHNPTVAWIIAMFSSSGPAQPEWPTGRLHNAQAANSDWPPGGSGPGAGLTPLRRASDRDVYQGPTRDSECPRQEADAQCAQQPGRLMDPRAAGSTPGTAPDESEGLLWVTGGLIGGSSFLGLSQYPTQKRPPSGSFRRDEGIDVGGDGGVDENTLRAKCRHRVR
jgi:hypothetical protein